MNTTQRAAQVSALALPMPTWSRSPPTSPPAWLARPPKSVTSGRAVCVIIAAVSVLGAVVLSNPDNYPAFALALFSPPPP